MSKIILQQLDFSTLGFPTGEFIIGIDVSDGLPKLRTPSDTIILGVTGSSYLQYEEVSYLQFVNLVTTSSLIPGGIYLINDFRTKHYIQYTDTNGNGTANNEAINNGTIEQILVSAISNNNYDRKVISLQYPSDEIYWKHDAVNREKEYVLAGGRGLIYFRKSADGNQRDYDFRAVKFRRWNDGSGNYNIVRAIDSPGWPSGFLLLDFIDYKSFEEGFQIMKNNKVGSMSDVPNVLSVPYFMDNFVFSTFSQAYDNDIKESHGVTIDALEFAGNEIDLIGNSKFINQSTTFNYNKFKNITNSNLFGLSDHNSIQRISSSSISNELYGNIGIHINSSNLGTFSNNRFNSINSCSFSVAEFNNIENISATSSLNYSYNYSKSTNDYSVDFNFTYSNFNIAGTNSQTLFNIDAFSNFDVNLIFTYSNFNIAGTNSQLLNFNNDGFQFNITSTSSNFNIAGTNSQTLFNIDAFGTITIATPSTSTSSNFLVFDNNEILFKQVLFNDGATGPTGPQGIQGATGTGLYTVYDINVMTYSITVSSYGSDYFGVGFTSSPVTINLPSISSIPDGKLVTIKDETGDASTNPITINTDGLDTLDGLTQSQLAINYGSISVIKKSNGWWLI
jgi:hypothetical protein